MPQRESGISELGPVGRCGQRPTLFIGIVDDSGSITAPGGADPISNRYGEIRAALEPVAKACRCGRDLAAVVHFDTPHGDAGPHPLAKTGVTRLQSGLAVPDGLGISDLLPAMLRATEIAAAHPEHHAVAAVLSDFWLFDRDLAAVAEAITAFPGTVLGCSLGARPVHEFVGLDQVIPIPHDSAPGAVARAVMAGLTLHRVSSRAGKAPISRRLFHNTFSRFRVGRETDD